MVSRGNGEKFGGIGVKSGGIGVKSRGIEVDSGVIGARQGVGGWVQGWRDESEGAGGHIPMLNAKSLKNRGCSGLLGSMRLNLGVLGLSVGVLG